MHIFALLLASWLKVKVQTVYGVFHKLSIIVYNHITFTLDVTEIRADICLKLK